MRERRNQDKQARQEIHGNKKREKEEGVRRKEVQKIMLDPQLAPPLLPLSSSFLFRREMRSVGPKRGISPVARYIGNEAKKKEEEPCFLLPSFPCKMGC